MKETKAHTHKKGGNGSSPPAAREQIIVPHKEKKGADIIVDSLIREGVEVMFGLPGGASMEIHQALTRSHITVILCRHEQGEIFAAEGYAKASGRVGVCVATSGPGATNLVTGIVDAKMDSVPIVAITGQVPSYNIGRDAFQETPIVEVARPITKHCYLVKDIHDIPRVIKEAFCIASTGRPGPVLVDIPKDTQQSRTVPEFPETVSFRGYHPYVQASFEDLEEIVTYISEAKRPILYVGGGVVTAEASEALRMFAHKTNIPVATTLMGLGTFREDDPLALKMLGMHGTVYANYAINHADLLLAFGVRFDDRVTGKVEEFAKHGKIVHVDIDPSELNKNKVAHLPIVSDIRYALEQLNEMVIGGGDYTEWHEQIAEWKRMYPLTYKQDGSAIMPQYVIQLIRHYTKGEAILTSGVGQHQMWAAQYYDFIEPRTWLTSGGLGAMGFGLPAAIGAKLACPDRTVIDIDGDGSFVMNVQELATAYAHQIPVKVVIINNQHLGMVVQWEDRFYASNRAHTYIGDPHAEDEYPDFVKLAEGFKVPGQKVTTKQELPRAVEEMLTTDTPYVLDVIVPYQEHVLPMIPSGKTYRDIIIE
ncbi:MAG: biosynthetic-type acetolactate synthase large subunit [Candidatus Latescibacteria bacterium]|nr:biosynthetic-type acetolactate synthase large subunit [Candidatus Latescibacterota bacterium]